MTAFPRALTRFVPRPARRGVSRLLGEIESGTVVRELGRLAPRGDVIAGPWLGEVGFELLYWIPFLRWALDRAGVGPDRVTAISRGGPTNWYRGIAGRYVDVFDHVTPAEFQASNAARAAATGAQKQVVLDARDRAILEAALPGVAAAERPLIHPSMMYGLFKRYWWGHVDSRWIRRHSKVEPFAPPDLDDLSLDLPKDYVATRFYFNECFPPTPENRTFIASVLASLQERGPVVELATGLRLDDHVEGHGGIGPGSISSLMTPRNNLQLQSAIVARARAFVGTYGGFSYLAPFYGVPSWGVFSVPSGFARSHLLVARQWFADLKRPDFLTLVDASAERAAAIAAHTGSARELAASDAR
jgi:hypothetical protein